ncbi:MAG: glycosyltransferase [Acidimicrobiia bacterium]|nr:glycosyltransferase [Acidimicrobiia bacterium]
MSDVSGLSVVVPTRNRPHLLARCLESVSASLRAGDELIVADSGGPDATIDAMTADAKARHVRSRPGASYQRNLGAFDANHEIVAFVDDDVRVAPGWAAAIANAFAAHPEVAFVTGRLDVPDEQRGYGRPVSVKDEPEPATLTPSMGGTLGHSANMAVRRSAFERVGGFDERLGPGAAFRAAEDGDLIDRLFAAGYVGRYEPAVLGWHDQWRTRNDLVRLEWSYGIGQGARLARLTRSDRARAKALAAEYLWRNALRPLPSHIVRRNEYAIVFALARVAGASLGFIRALLSRFGSTPPAARTVLR